MARRKFETRIVSYGIYTPFEKGGKDLPKIVEFTTAIPARIGVEFGYILNIKKARGQKLLFTIDHPPFPDENGQVAPPFEGEVYVRSNDWRFFLGDTFWQPLEDKLGTWTLTVHLNGQTIATKQFKVVKDDDEAED